MSESIVPRERPLSVGQCATMACLLELSAPKPGNVHRGADFDDVGFADFALSAIAFAPELDAAAAGEPVGSAVRRAVVAARRVVDSNTYLGTLLLIVPMAKASRLRPWPEGLPTVLAELDAADAREVYAAIRAAQPSGLGRVEQGDVSGPPPDDLLAAMRLAADRDLIARQYVNGFREVAWTAQQIRAAADAGLCRAIVAAQVQLMAAHPDSLIGRKCGPTVASESAARAAAVWAAGPPGSTAYQRELQGLDAWLRADGHRRNPGTTADLITAALFGLLRDGELAWPLNW